MIVNVCARYATRPFRWVVVLLLLSVSLAEGQPREPLTVMSFNIRYGIANDGENHWTARREMVFEVIREQDADLVGLQEALASQIDEIVAAVPGYAVVGVGRDDAARKGVLGDPVQEGSAAGGRSGHVLVFGHAGGSGFEVVG